MFRVFIIGDATEQIRRLSSGLVQKGFACSITPNNENAIEQVIGQAPDLMLIAVDSPSAILRMGDLAHRITQEKHVPVIALLSKADLDSLDVDLTIDDFVVEPWDITEVVLRMKRVLTKANEVDTEELIKCDGLFIDLTKYEVSIDGERVPLTFKEYELLRFLASNRGRVFTRQALLSQVWGYDYYGGDRTVDVHIRRLRSKIEDSAHTFIETVRNVGYGFKAK